MSKHAEFDITPEEQAENEAFLRGREVAGERYIKRHSRQARWTHGITVSCCMWLMFSGAFVFVPPLAAMVGPDVVFAFRMSHRILGVVFVLVPIISAIMAPAGVKHIIHNNICHWTEDDKKWMILFLPYLFMAKWIHMPDQDEQKSGQRVADGALWISGIIMGITGVLLLLNSTILPMGTGAHSWLLFFHDLFFCIMLIFALAHIFLGAGIFQPYRGMWKGMWKDGLISESDALYHWGHWARDVLKTDNNVVRKKDDEK